MQLCAYVHVYVYRHYIHSMHDRQAVHTPYTHWNQVKQHLWPQQWSHSIFQLLPNHLKVTVRQTTPFAKRYLRPGMWVLHKQNRDTVTPGAASQHDSLKLKAVLKQPNRPAVYRHRHKYSEWESGDKAWGGGPPCHIQLSPCWVHDMPANVTVEPV